MLLLLLLLGLLLRLGGLRGGRIVPLDLLLDVQAGEQGLALADLQPQGQRAEGLHNAVPGLEVGVGHADLGEDALRRAGHDEADHHRHPAHALGQGVQHGGQAGLAALVATQHPGLGHVNVLVALADELPDFLQRAGELEGVDLLLHPGRSGLGQIPQGPVDALVHRVDSGDGAAKVLLDHRHRAGDQVAQVIGQIGVDAGEHGLEGELAVGAEGHLPHQEVAHRVGGIPVAQHHGIHHVAHGLAHLLAVDDQPAVAEHLLGQGQTQGVEHDGPDDGMEAHDLLADQMHIRRPVFAEQFIVVGAVAQGGDVVAQRVQPDIHRVLLVEGHGDAPLDGRAADAQVVQARAQEVIEHLVGAGGGLDEVGMLLDVLDQPVLVLAQLEEVAFLPGLFHGTAAVGALAVLELQLRPEGLAGGAVPALVFALVDVALLVELLEDALHAFHMPLVGGTDEIVVLDVHQLPQLLDARHDVIYIGLGRDALVDGLALDLLTVLVGAGEEVHVIARQLLEAGHGVRGGGAVGVADVQVVAGVVDGGCDVEGLLALLAHGISPPSWLRTDARKKSVPCLIGAD